MIAPMHKRLIALPGLLALLLLLLTACGSYEYKGATLDPPKPIADFTLPAHDGTEFRLSEHQDDLLLVYFGYTYCPDVCPATMYQIKRAMNELGDKADAVQVVMVTVDPERDTAGQIGSYVTNFDERFLGLRTTNLETLDAVMSDFGAYYTIEEPEEGESGYLVSHTAAVFVLKDGALVEIFPYGTTGEDMASDLKHILRGR
jgi:protein SCO1/2